VVHSLSLTTTNTTFEFSPNRITGIRRFGVAESGSGVAQSNLSGAVGFTHFTDAQLTKVFYTYVVTLEPPRVDDWTRTGSDLILTGSGGSANGEYYLLTSTNLLVSLPGWVRMATNFFASDGTFS